MAETPAAATPAATTIAVPAVVAAIAGDRLTGRRVRTGVMTPATAAGMASAATATTVPPPQADIAPLDRVIGRAVSARLGTAPPGATRTPAATAPPVPPMAVSAMAATEVMPVAPVRAVNVTAGTGTGTGGDSGGDRPDRRSSGPGASRSDGGFRGGDRPTGRPYGGGTGRSEGGYRGGDRPTARPSYGGNRSDSGFRGGDRPTGRSFGGPSRSDGGFRGGDRPTGSGAPRREFGDRDRGFDRGPSADRGYDRRPSGDRGGDRDSRAPFAGGDRPRYDSDRRDGGFRGRDGGQGREGGERSSSGAGYRGNQDGASRPSRPAYGRSGGQDRPAGGQGFSRTMSSRIGGAFPEDRTGRPERSERSERPRSAGRPADRRTSFGAGNRTDRPARPGGPSSYGSRPRPSGDVDRDRERPDRRRDERRAAASELPRIPDSITEDQLSKDVKSELGGLPADLAIMVGRYLVAAELASDPEQSYRYAQAARHYAARIGIVREVSGIAAYKTGRWTEALAELRAARRLTGRNDYLALMADAERGLGRLDRALEVVHSPEAKRLPRAAQIELRIVESGIRRDQGLADAAVLALQVPELTDGKLRPWSARLFYAYGDALLAAGRREAAREAFSRAVVADEDEQTDALARLDELDGITVADLEDDEDEEDDELDTSDESGTDLDDDDDEDDEDDEDLDDEADAELDDEEDDDEEDDGERDDLDDEEDPYEADLDAVVEEKHDAEGDDTTTMRTTRTTSPA